MFLLRIQCCYATKRCRTWIHISLAMKSGSFIIMFEAIKDGSNILNTYETWLKRTCMKGMCFVRLQRVNFSHQNNNYYALLQPTHKFQFAYLGKSTDFSLSNMGHFATTTTQERIFYDRTCRILKSKNVKTFWYPPYSSELSLS